MGWIPKIVSTPAKWASKKILKKTVLQFPGGEANPTVACVYCPEMCRFSCPTAVVTGNDTVTPCNKMSFLYKTEKWPQTMGQGGPVSQSQALWPIYDCTGCGRCTEYCIYGMPVMERLFEARRKYPWQKAKQVASGILDSDDPYGDLADELGDHETAQRRLKAATLPVGGVWEPRSFYYLNKNEISVPSAWSEAMASHTDVQSSALKKALGSKKWLVHESVWASRHLKQSQKMLDWVNHLKQEGLKLEMPFAFGMDCVDCGGEGAFKKLFPEQAKQMALDIWERDQDRVDGIFCFSRRCAEHFRSSLGSAVPVIALCNVTND